FDDDDLITAPSLGLYVELWALARYLRFLSRLRLDTFSPPQSHQRLGTLTGRVLPLLKELPKPRYLLLLAFKCLSLTKTISLLLGPIGREVAFVKGELCVFYLRNGRANPVQEIPVM